MSYQEIPTYLLYVSNKNVRKNLQSDDEIESNLDNLTKDIKNNGLINPLSVRKINDKYEIYAGQRRFLAIQNLKWDKIPCIINDYDDKKVELLSLAENIQRNRMNNVDKCSIFHKYYELSGKSIDKVAEITALSPSTVRNYVFLKENLSSKLLPKLDDKTDKLTIDHAKEICKNIPNKEKQTEAFDKTKKLPDTETKKKVLEKVKLNPNKNIQDIIDEVNNDYSSDSDNDQFDLRNNPWIYDIEDKTNKIKIPPNMFELVYNIIVAKDK
jgi:ParB family chromosome partitioning protein